MEDKTTTLLGQRVPHSAESVNGWVYVETIPPDIACVIALPGSSTDTSKKANGFAKMIESVIDDKSIPIFTAEYHRSGRVARYDREVMLSRYNQHDPVELDILQVSYDEQIYIPQYIKDIYKKVLAPRLRIDDGKKALLPLVARRLNMLTFINHCHGTTVAMHLETLLKEDMTNLGYTKAQQKYLLGQVHNIDIAPVSPFGITETTTYKFISFSDDVAMSVNTSATAHIKTRKDEHNCHIQAIRNHNKFMQDNTHSFSMDMSLFEVSGREMVFAINSFYPDAINKQKKYDGIEHVFDTYTDRDDCVNEQGNITKRNSQGTFLHLALSAVTKWVVRHAKLNEQTLTELPKITEVPELAPHVSRGMKNKFKFLKNEIALYQMNSRF